MENKYMVQQIHSSSNLVHEGQSWPIQHQMRNPANGIKTATKSNRNGGEGDLFADLGKD